MANISAIKLPNGTTYNLKDSVSGYLTTHQTLYEESIQWGATSNSKTGSVSPIGMALSTEHSSNRLAFINGDALTFEYSSDGGSTYTNYNYAKADKTAFCTTSYGVPIGRISGNYTTSSRTRITLTAQNGTTGYVYTNPKKLLINISSSGGMQVLIEYRTGTNYQNNGSWSTFGTYNLSGWSGWNDIPLILGTLGGGTTQTGNNWQLRLTFIMTSVNSSYPTTAHVNSIRLFGENGWQVTSNLGNTGHLYSYDVNQNATFPAKVTANGGFSGNLTGNVTGNVSGSAGSVAWSGVTSKPTTLSGYGITDAKIANGVITLGSNTITPLTSHQDISGKADKSATVSNVTYDSTNAKITKTINGTTSDVVTVATLKTALGSMPASDVYSWAKASTKPTYTASEVGAATSGHTHTTSIATSTATNQITLAYGTKYALTAGGTSYVFTMPSADDTNTWRTIQVNGTDVLGSGTGTGKLNLKAGTNVSISNSSGTVTISSTDTNTDTKVTSVGNHYTPAEDTSATLSADASSTTAATWNSTSLVTGVNLQRDAKGHVVGVTVDSIKMPANPNSHNTYTISNSGSGNAVTAISLSGTTFTVTKGTSFLTSHQTIKQDGVTGATGNHFGTSSTAAATAAKTVSITAGTPTLETGLRVTVKFTYANTANSPTLNVNSLGAKNIFHNGAQITSGTNKALLAGTVEFVYDGTQWQLVGNYIDTNTTYSIPTKASSATTSITASTTATKTTLGTAFTIPNVTSVGSASTWAFTDVACDDITAWSAGSASTWAFTGVTVANSITGAVDSSDSTQLNITLGTTTVQSKSSGSNGTAPSLSYTARTVSSKSSGSNGTAPSLGTAFTVPNVTGNTSATVSITDNGHTHNLS